MVYLSPVAIVRSMVVIAANIREYYMVKSYLWKLLKNGELRDVEIHGPYYDDYKLEEGPFASIEEAEAELEAYFKKYHKDYGEYGSFNSEEFVLLTVYSK